MKKIVLLSSISSLIFAATSLAAVKPVPGQTCTKIGLVQVISNSKYTCIKSGKKLIWSNPVKIKAAPSPISSTTPRSRPTVTQSQTANPEISTSLARLISIWNEIQTLKSKNDSSNLLLEFMYSPTVDRAYADRVLAGFKGAAQFWQKQFIPKEPMPVLIFTEKDRNWYKEQFVAMGLNSENINFKLSGFDDEVSRNGKLINMAGMNGYRGITWFEFSFGTESSKYANSVDGKLYV